MTRRIAFEDSGLPPARVSYRLAFEESGARCTAGEVALVIPAPARLELLAVAPNPVARDLTVRFTLAGDSPARLELLDLAGRRLRVREARGAGEQSVRFEDLGRMEPGLYVVRLAQGAQVRSARVAVVR